MICPKCQKAIPPGKLACLSCLQKAYDAETLKAQVDFMPGVRDGRLLLSTAQAHLIRFGDHRRTLCGRPMAGTVRRAVSFRSLDDGPLVYCPQCRKILDDLMTQAGVRP